MGVVGGVCLRALVVVSVQEGAEAAHAVTPELVPLDGDEHLLTQQVLIRPHGPDVLHSAPLSATLRH